MNVRLICLVAGLSASSFCHSLLAESDPITLQTLTDYVYLHHPARQAEASMDALASSRSALAEQMFAAPLSLSMNHFNDAIGGGHGLQEWETAIEMPIWLPGERRHQQNLSRHLAAEVPYYQQRIRLEASAQVRAHVWLVMQAAAKVRHAESLLAAADNILGTVDRQIEADLLPASERLLAQSHQLAMQSALSSANRQLQQALNQYHYLTGQRVLPEVIEERLPVAVEIRPDHPLLAEIDQQIARQRSAMANARYDDARHPTLSVGVKRERDEHADPYSNSLGVGVSFALNNAQYQQPAVALASRQLADLQIARQQQQRQLETQLLAAMDTLKSWQQEQHSLTEQLTVSDQYIALQQESFESGSIDLATLLRSQQINEQQRYQLLQLEVDIQQQIATINQLAGHLL